MEVLLRTYEEACFKGAQEDGEDVLIDGSFEVINQIPFEKLIKELDFLPDSLSSIVKIKSIDREYILSADGSVSEAFAIYINELKPKTYQVNSANNIIIIDKKLEDDYKFLDTKKLKSIIFKNISEHLDTFFSEITLWRPDSTHLLWNKFH